MRSLRIVATGANPGAIRVVASVMPVNHAPARPPAGSSVLTRLGLLCGLIALLVGCGAASGPEASVVATSPGTASTTGPTTTGPATATTSTTAPGTTVGPSPLPTIGELRRRPSTTPAPGLAPPPLPTSPFGPPATGPVRGVVRPVGSLVLRNSTYVAVLDVATGDERRTEPRDAPFGDPGVGVWRGGRIALVADRGRDGFDIDVYDRALTVVQRLSYPSELSFVTGTATFDRTGELLAFSVDELTSATDDTRIARTVVMRVATGEVVARFDGVEQPVWTGARDELVVREADGDALRVIDASGRDRGRIAGVTVAPGYGAYDVGADGRFVVWTDGTAVRALDRDSGQQWTAAHDRIGTVRAPVLSPDGRFLALLANVREEDAPHVVPFAPGTTVDIDSSVHALELSFVNVRGRIGWMA